MIDLAHAVASFDLSASVATGFGEVVGNFGNEVRDMYRGSASAFMPEDVMGHRIGTEAAMLREKLDPTGESGNGKGFYIQSVIEQHHPLTLEEAKNK